MNVFVSYQRADTAMAAHAVFYALRLAGHEAYIDTGDIGAGQFYRQVIANAISGSHLLLALIGPAFDVGRLCEPTSVVTFEWQRARFHDTAVVPVLVDGGSMPHDDQLPPQLRWFSGRNAIALRRACFAADVAACISALPAIAALPRRAARVLWVDDRPANNEYERKLLREHGIVFDNVVSTTEAIEQLGNEAYDLVITDLGAQGIVRSLLHRRGCVPRPAGHPRRRPAGHRLCRIVGGGATRRSRAARRGRRDGQPRGADRHGARDPRSGAGVDRRVATLAPRRSTRVP